MLFATFGAVWTICILCIVFAAIYLHGLHKHRYKNPAYAWDAPRLWMLYVLGVSVCYLGTARLASTLSDMLMLKLTQHPVPFLYAEQWLNLSAICAVIALMIGLLRRGERIESVDPELQMFAQEDQSLLTDIRTLPTPTILPEDSTTYLEAADLPQPINALDEQYAPNHVWQTLRGGLVPSLMATVGVLVLVVIAWLAFLSANRTFVSADAQQAAVPEIDANTLNALVVPNGSSLVIAAQPTDSEVASGVAVSGRSALTASPASVDTAANVEQATLPQLAEPTAVYTSSIPISLVSSANLPSEESTNAVAPNVSAPPVAEVAVEAVAVAAAPQQAIIRVPNTYEVNARLSPTVDSAILYVLPSGATADIQERLPNGQWALVLLPDGRQAWVATWVVDVIEPSF